MFSSTSTVRVGARSSPLSQAQVGEVLKEMQAHHPELAFDPLFVKSTGDLDKKTSLRTLGKTDFFTKEIDAMVLAGECQVGIHSAKDLPEPLTDGLVLIALTKGVDPSDALVLRPGASIESLPHGAIIATSSERREEAVRQLCPQIACRFVDIRGTIGERLAILEQGEIHGVVIAEAALIRLQLTGLNRVRLPGATVPFQGQLAIIARDDDVAMRELFSCIHHRSECLL